MGIKYRVNEYFFNRWNRRMAYVLGYLYADGSLEDAPYLRGKYVRVSSIDRCSISRIKKLLESEHNIVIKRDDIRKTQYFLRIGSKKIFNSLISRGLFPNKSLTVSYPRVPRRYKKDFIRGYFDGDGCVHLWLSKNKRGRMITRKLSVIFTSGSKIFLRQLNKDLHECCNVWKKIYVSRRSYQLRYGTDESVRIFKFLYRCVGEEFLYRKFIIFRKYFLRRPDRIDKTVRDILSYPHGHVVK